MLHRRHNMVSILYSIRGMIESHIVQVREDRFRNIEDRLAHAEVVLKRACAQADAALNIVRCLNGVMQPRQRFLNHCAKTSVRLAWRKVIKEILTDSPELNIEIIEHVPHPFPSIRCVSQEFEEVVHTLVRNSVEAMHGKGKIIVRAELTYSAQGETLALIKLSDTGPGIAEDKIACLFHPFFTTKEEGRGNGLGLYLAKEFVVKNDGKISVSSFEGFGCTFSIEFHLAVSETREKVSSSS